MTIVDSLKKFLTKLGGNPNELENNATSAEIIDAISEAYTDKEGTYTEVTPIGSEGTKIATIKTNNVDHDIYVPIPDLSNLPNGTGLAIRNGKIIANKAYQIPMLSINDEGYSPVTTKISGNIIPIYKKVVLESDLPDFNVLKFDCEVASAGGATSSINLLNEDEEAITFADMYLLSDAKISLVRDQMNNIHTTNINAMISNARGAVVIDFLVWDFTNSVPIHKIYKATFSTAAERANVMQFSLVT